MNDPNTAGEGGAADSGNGAGPAPVESNPVLATVRKDDIGEHARNAVRLDFNPSGDERVNEIKVLTARLLSLSWGEGGDAARCGAIARTHFETAAMWAVKAATASK